MGQSCTICNHIKRLEIDRSLVSNKNVANLSKKYGVSYSALLAHRKNHLSRELVRSKQMRDIFIGKNLLNVIEDLLNSSLNILEKCEKKPSKYNTALKAISESRKTVEFLYECSIAFREIRNEEEKQKIQDATAIHEERLSRLTNDELETLARLNQKMEGLHQGRRNDLLLTKHKHRTNQKKLKIAGNKRYREKKKAEPTEIIRRRKVHTPKPEKPIDEFDQMRDRLGISNNPEPIKDGWMDI